jgi:hypothetical protein
LGARAALNKCGWQRFTGNEAAVASTRYGWLQDLEALSPTVAALNLTAQVSDEPYWDTVTNLAINADAFNLSGCPHHNGAIARWLGGLAANGVTQSQLSRLLVDLTSRNTYGTFSELSGYGLLLDAHLPFQIQVPMGKAGILNPNGADLDGRLTISGDVLFDIKAFGLHEHLSNRLHERLSGEFSSQFVAIEGSADVAVSVMTDLLGRGYSSLVSELRAKGLARRDGLDVSLRPTRQVQVTSGTLDPYALAKNHAEYAFGFAKQFARRKPFMLIFVIHPWLGGLRLSTDFPGDADTFMRSFARRTFMQFLRDKAKIFGVSRAIASRLLSGIMFINAWQPTDAKHTHRLFLNPYAKHPIPGLTVRRLEVGIPGLRKDDFQNDVY